MTSIVCAFPWYARAIDRMVGGRGVGGRSGAFPFERSSIDRMVGGRGVGGVGVGGKGGTFPFDRSSMVPDIFVVIFRVRNGRTGGISRQVLQ